jgi:hypothetical protein
MTVKFTNIFRFKAHEYLPELGFLVLKYTIWQPWPAHDSNEMFTFAEKNQSTEEVDKMKTV